MGHHYITVSRYVTEQEYSQAKRRLTIALKKGPKAVLDEVERTLLGDWREKAWPDDWHRWNIAVSDVFFSRDATDEDRERAREIMDVLR